MPKISVVVPVYNVKKYLEKCLNSLVNQTFSDIEIICIDDGSTDGSNEILTEFQNKDRRFIIKKQSNQGAGAARNYGIEIANGEYILFFDSDDYCELNFLEEMYNHAKKYDSDLVVCSYRKVDDNGNVTESRNPNSPIRLDRTPLEECFCYKDFKDEIFELLTPVPWNKLYKKSLLTDNRIKFPNLHICEDIAFVYSCIACAKNIIVFDDELINYRYNRPESMATYRTKYTIDVVHSCLALKEFLISKNLYKELHTAFMNAFKNHIRWEIALCSDKEYKKFLKEFKKLMPNDWYLFESALRKDYLTLDYLQNFIGNKKIMFWGASNLLRKILSNEKDKNSNILGIIDRNTASWGKKCGNYEIYSPDSLGKIKPDGVIMSIWSNYESVYPELEKEFANKYPDIELLPNIFEKEMEFTEK